jgi:hypothetical protein
MLETQSLSTQINEGRMARSKQLALVAVLIAIGAVLRMFTPPIAGITPNFVIAMYCLAILLIRPNPGGAVGIGLVGGAVAMMFSKSPIPYLNLVSEPAGALACALTVLYLPAPARGGYSFKPALATIIGTLVSGTLSIMGFPPGPQIGAISKNLLELVLIVLIMIECLKKDRRRLFGKNTLLW